MRIQGCSDCAQTLGAFTPPADCQSGFFVTRGGYEADGTYQRYINDVPATQVDFDALAAWQANCRAEMQRRYDEESAKRALELAQQPISPGWASYGPGSNPSQAPGVSLAVQYVESIQDPALKQQAASAVVTAVQQNPTNPGAVTVTTPSGQVVTIAPNVSTVPGPGGGGAVIEAGFPDEMHTAQPAPVGGGNSMLALAAIAALAFLG